MVVNVWLIYNTWALMVSDHWWLLSVFSDMMCLESRLNYPPLGAPLTPLGPKPASQFPGPSEFGGQGGNLPPYFVAEVEVKLYPSKIHGLLEFTYCQKQITKKSFFCVFTFKWSRKPNFFCFYMMEVLTFDRFTNSVQVIFYLLFASAL